MEISITTIGDGSNVRFSCGEAQANWHDPQRPIDADLLCTGVDEGTLLSGLPQTFEGPVVVYAHGGKINTDIQALNVSGTLNLTVIHR